MVSGLYVCLWCVLVFSGFIWSLVGFCVCGYALGGLHFFLESYYVVAYIRRFFKVG